MNPKSCGAIRTAAALISIGLLRGEGTGRRQQSDNLGTMALEVKTVRAAEGGTPYVPRAGDYLQWEPRGAIQFREPRKVTAISTDGSHVFVNGSSTVSPQTKQSRFRP
jgi:hypothetical protein